MVITKPLNWVEDKLGDFHFFRTHDSYLVNLFHIKKITHVREGAEVLLSDNRTIEVSKRKKALFLETISRINILN